MKNSLLAGLFLLFITILILILLTGGYALYMAGGIASSGIEVNGSLFFKVLISSLPILAAPALTAGFFFTFLRLRTKPGIRILTSLIICATGALLFWVTVNFLGSMAAPGLFEKPSAHSEYRSGLFTKTPGGSLIYRNKTDSEEFKGLIIRFDEENGTSMQTISIPPENTGETPPLTVSAFPNRGDLANPVFSDLTLISSTAVKLKSSGQILNFLLAIIAFSLYLTSCWGVIQMSRWPFFNMVMLLLLLTWGGALFRLFSADIFQEFIALIGTKTRGVPPVLLAQFSSALLLFLLDLLFIPYNRRIEES